MKKTSLQIMEQLVMTAVFALAAAICLQCFAAGYNISITASRRDAAVRTLDGIIENYMTDDRMPVPDGFDADWNPCGQENAVYDLISDSGEITILSPDGKVLASRALRPR